MRKSRKSHTQNPITTPQLSYDCRRKIHRAKMLVLLFEAELMCGETNSASIYIPYLLSCVHDDIKAVDKELISLGLFDEAMGKKRRKSDAN
ncbi:TPA: hypothetical protein N3G98_000933 [Salmonella enterica subsp. enterica serovar Denver]|nr:hypothetical protein [Salmonella enterica subsp. enterica serovar Denver]